MSGKFGKMIGAVVAALALLFVGFNAHAMPKVNDGNPNIVDITTEQQYNDAMAESNKRPVLIEFGKEKCIPCEQLRPVMEEKANAENGAFLLARIDGTQLPKIWEKYGKPWFPTLIGVKAEKETYRHSGYDGNADAIKKWVDSALGLHNAPPPAPPVTEMDVTSADMDKVKAISNEKVVILKVGAEWCGPCQQLAPVISGFAKDDGGKWMLGKIDGDKSPDLVKQFKVDAYPTMLVFYKGVDQTQSVERHIGYNGDPQEVRAWLDKALSFHYPTATPTVKGATN